MSANEIAPLTLSNKDCARLMGVSMSLFLGLGATMGSAAMSGLGIWFTTSTGIIITSILNAFVAALILISGFKNYVRFQTVMIIGTILAFVTMLVVLFLGSPATSMASIDAFALKIAGVENFVQTAIDASTAAGVDLNPPFSMLAMLMVKKTMAKTM